jgi:TonB family protein
MTMLLDLTLRSSILIALGLGMRMLLRHRSAALRHRVLAVSLLAAVSVGPLAFVLPEWSPPAPPPTPAAAAAAAGNDQPVAVSAFDVRDVTPVRAALPLMTIWGIGVAIGAGMLVLGMTRLVRIGARSRVIADGPLASITAEIAGEYGLRRPVTLLQSNEAGLLATWGVIQSRVLLPTHATTWTRDRARTVLCHELAHIQRSDWIVQMGAELLRVVCWFNPLVWIACSRLRYDSEQACDDVVLRAGVRADTYADHLLELARICRRPVRTWASAMLMARPSTLERRIAAMLKPGLKRGAPSRRAIVMTCLLLAVVTLPLAAYRSAQTTPLQFTGLVYDSTGAVLPDVEVSLVDSAEGQAKVLSGPDGRFSLPSIAPGKYLLEASRPGFKALKQEIELKTARDWDRAITLQVGDVQETISVREKRPATPKPATQATPGPTRVAVGGNIRAPMKLVDVKPVYPASMRDAGKEGVVPIQAFIAEDGSVTSARVLTAQVHPDFARAALEAVQQWRFQPTLLNGKPVEVVMNVSVTFSLGD